MHLRGLVEGEKQPMSRKPAKRAEEYLEVIYQLIRRGEKPGVRKIARILGVKPSSALEYLRRLCREGLIIYQPGGDIELTGRGLEIAREISRRHEILRRFLIELGVPPEIADEDACYIEHGVHPETLEKIIEFLDKVKKMKC